MHRKIQPRRAMLAHASQRTSYVRPWSACHPYPQLIGGPYHAHPFGRPDLTRDPSTWPRVARPASRLSRAVREPFALAFTTPALSGSDFTAQPKSSTPYTIGTPTRSPRNDLHRVVDHRGHSRSTHGPSQNCPGSPVPSRYCSLSVTSAGPFMFQGGSRLFEEPLTLTPLLLRTRPAVARHYLRGCGCSCPQLLRWFTSLHLGSALIKAGYPSGIPGPTHLSWLSRV